MGFCAEMVVTNTSFVFEKILNHVFSHKNFLISFLRKGDLDDASGGQNNIYAKCKINST